MGGLVPCASRLSARWLWLGGLLAAVGLGALLRLVWVDDIEFKADEAWTFQQTQELARTGAFPWLGMPSSAGFRNPGMSVWVFLLLGKLAGADQPTGLARGVQALNIAAVVLLGWFAWRRAEEREPWLWAAALVSVNPLAVLVQRKIWPPSVLPLFSLLMLIGWWRREQRWGAFAWGLVGLCLGQIHMAGFFFAAGFLTWALLFDRQLVAWRAWLAGSLLGALPLIPWLGYLLAEHHGRPHAGRWVHLFEFKFWVRWVKEPLGFGLDYVLGDDFDRFLSYPLVNGRPTALVSLLLLLTAVVGILLLFRGGYYLWQERRQLAGLAVGRGSPSAFTQNAALWGFGVWLTASGFYVQRHYLVVTFPLEFVWLARLALGPPGPRARGLRLGRALLLVLCLSQLLLTVNFLEYIHVNQGARDGDYGPCYAATQRLTSSAPSVVSRKEPSAKDLADE